MRNEGIITRHDEVTILFILNTKILFFLKMNSESFKQKNLDFGNDSLELQFINGDKYIGKLENNLFEGEGEYIFSNGNKYKGQFLKGVFNGEGIFYDNINSYIYEGNYQENLLVGSVCVKSQNDGSEYYGELKDGQREGKGMFKFSKDDKFCTMYEGEFKNNLFDGQGKLYFKNGAIYNGTFVKNKIEGYSRLNEKTYEYEGNFDGGRKKGMGKMIYKNGDVYEGQFKNDMRNGSGTYKYADGSTYVGNWVDDLKQGDGELQINDEGTYGGKFIEGMMQGEGKIKLKTGEVYQGQFYENNANGDGKIAFPNGNQLIGKFKDNMKMGECIYLKKDRAKEYVYQGQFNYNIEKTDKAVFPPRY